VDEEAKAQAKAEENNEDDFHMCTRIITDYVKGKRGF
jgi:hypothetical protein